MFSGYVAAWLSGSALASINEVTLHRVRLVVGWVTVFRRVNHQFVTSHSGQLSLLPLAGRKMNIGQSAVTLCGWGVEAGRYGSFRLRINVWVVGKTV